MSLIIHVIKNKIKNKKLWEVDKTIKKNIFSFSYKKFLKIVY